MRHDHDGSSGDPRQARQSIKEEPHVLCSVSIGAGGREGSEGVDDDKIEAVERDGVRQQLHMGGEIERCAGPDLGEH